MLHLRSFKRAKTRETYTGISTGFTDGRMHVYSPLSRINDRSLVDRALSCSSPVENRVPQDAIDVSCDCIFYSENLQQVARRIHTNGSSHARVFSCKSRSVRRPRKLLSGVAAAARAAPKMPLRFHPL